MNDYSKINGEDKAIMWAVIVIALVIGVVLCLGIYAGIRNSDKWSQVRIERAEACSYAEPEDVAACLAITKK